MSEVIEEVIEKVVEPVKEIVVEKAGGISTVGVVLIAAFTISIILLVVELTNGRS